MVIFSKQALFAMYNAKRISLDEARYRLKKNNESFPNGEPKDFPTVINVPDDLKDCYNA